MTTLDNATIAQVATCCNCCATAASEESYLWVPLIVFGITAVILAGVIVFILINRIR